jgi:hypothetical protein
MRGNTCRHFCLNHDNLLSVNGGGCKEDLQIHRFIPSISLEIDTASAVLSDQMDITISASRGVLQFGTSDPISSQ